MEYSCVKNGIFIIIIIINCNWVSTRWRCSGDFHKNYQPRDVKVKAFCHTAPCSLVEVGRRDDPDYESSTPL
jgi:hypothetical protein